MTDLLKNHYEKQGKKVVDALNLKRFHAQYVSTKEEAVSAILSLINKKDTIGMGGSVTLEELKIKEELEKRGNMIFNHQGLAPEKAKMVRRQELTADVFIASSNAVTLEGEILNVDGVGNRVASLMFGPERQIVVMGCNKIVKDLEAARQRVGMVAAPMNADRLNKNTPCAKTGYCVDCKSPERICAMTAIWHTAPMGSDFYVIMVGESLGF